MIKISCSAEISFTSCLISQQIFLLINQRCLNLPSQTSKQMSHSHVRYFRLFVGSKVVKFYHFDQVYYKRTDSIFILYKKHTYNGTRTFLWTRCEKSRLELSRIIYTAVWLSWIFGVFSIFDFSLLVGVFDMKLRLTTNWLTVYIIYCVARLKLVPGGIRDYVQWVFWHSQSTKAVNLFG